MGLVKAKCTLTPSFPGSNPGSAGRKNLRKQALPEVFIHCNRVPIKVSEMYFFGQ